jgi:hypothetical protein
MYFAFMNGSVRGPFVECGKSKAWLQEFTSRLGSSNARDSSAPRLVGTTVNCNDHEKKYQVHLQSMFLVTDSTGIELMNTTWSCQDHRLGIISMNEVGMSIAFLNRGWNIAALEEYWRNWNFLDENKTRERCDQAGADPYFPGKEPFENGFRDVSPTEVIMFKTNRNVAKAELERLTVASEKCNQHSRW